MDWTVRQAARGDVSSICDLWDQMMAFHRQYDPRFEFGPGARREYENHVTGMLRSQGARVLVAVSGSCVVGFLVAEVHARKPVYPVGRYGFISDVCVAEDFRRQGIGRALVDAIQAWFVREKVTAIELYVAEANPVSSAFWQGLGFGPYLRLLRRDTESGSDG